MICFTYLRPRVLSHQICWATPWFQISTAWLQSRWNRTPCPYLGTCKSNKTYLYDIAEILLKVALNTMKQTSYRQLEVSVMFIKSYTVQVTDTLYHIMLYTSPWLRFEITKSVVIGTDCIGSCKSNYHMITANSNSNSSGSVKYPSVLRCTWDIFVL
jgi:hypothetical protein